MIMRDKIYFDGAWIRAHVGVTSGGVQGNQQTGFAFIEELRAIIPPDPRIKLNSPIWWRGEEYTVLEPPLIRRKAGRDHHMTVKLKRQSV